MRISKISFDVPNPPAKLQVGSELQATQLPEDAGPLEAGFLNDLNMLNMSIYGMPREAAMPIAGIYGPDDFGQPRSRASRRSRRLAAPAPPSARRALPMPSLEWTPEVERATAHLYERVKKRDLAGRVAADGALHQGDQRTEEEARRGHPGAQLSDAGDLPLRRRHRRRLAAARHRSHQGEVRHHRAVRRALHGGDLEDPQSAQDGPDPGFARRLLAGREHHRRGRAAVARAFSRRAGGRLCQHIGRREGGGRYLLHLVQRGAGGREPQCARR